MTLQFHLPPTMVNQTEQSNDQIRVAETVFTYVSIGQIVKTTNSTNMWVGAGELSSMGIDTTLPYHYILR